MFNTVNKYRDKIFHEAVTIKLIYSRDENSAMRACAQLIGKLSQYRCNVVRNKADKSERQQKQRGKMAFRLVAAIVAADELFGLSGHDNDLSS